MAGISCFTAVEHLIMLHVTMSLPAYSLEGSSCVQAYDCNTHASYVIFFQCADVVVCKHAPSFAVHF